MADAIIVHVQLFTIKKDNSADPHDLRAFWTVLPIITAAGAGCGLIGGSVNKFSGGGPRHGAAS
jgi:hypothetical protein